MKKLIILSLLLLIISGCAHKETQNKLTEDIIKVETQTLDISENGTEINLIIENISENAITISKVKAELYDSTSKKIATISKKITEQIKTKKIKTIKLTSKEKYPSTSKIKYIVYG